MLRRASTGRWRSIPGFIAAFCLTLYSFPGADAQVEDLAASGRSRPVVVALPHSTSGSSISRPSNRAGFNVSSQKKRSQASVARQASDFRQVIWGSVLSIAAHPQVTANILNASGLSPPLSYSIN